MKKTVFSLMVVLAMALLVQVRASEATDLVLTGATNLAVGSQGVISIPSSLALHNVTWATDASFLQIVSSSDLNCTVLPLQVGSVPVQATGYDLYGGAVTVGPTAFTILPGSQTAQWSLGTGRSYFVVGEQTSVALTVPLATVTSWWSSDSSILSVLSGWTGASCPVQPVKAGSATLYVSGTDASGRAVNLSHKFYALDTSNTLTITVEDLDPLTLKAETSQDVDISSKVHATFTLNGLAESADIDYAITATSSSTSVVKATIPDSGVLSFRLTAGTGGNAVVTVNPVLDGLSGNGNDYVTLQGNTMNVTVTGSGGSVSSNSGSGGGCSAGGLGLAGLMAGLLLLRRRG